MVFPNVNELNILFFVPTTWNIANIFYKMNAYDLKITHLNYKTEYFGTK